jgi:hypothetical protein
MERDERKPGGEEGWPIAFDLDPPASGAVEVPAELADDRQAARHLPQLSALHQDGGFTERRIIGARLYAGRHDDELLCDKRDTSPVQPGPFALWDAEDEAYVIKNVEKLAGGVFRIFSTNPKYTPREINREETHIIGRPVWFARRL